MNDLPAPGDLFEGKYRIEREIGSGGFAAVYRAVDQTTGRNVAIKILVPLEHESHYSERLQSRFEREARLLAGLRSQHTVTMYEFGRSEGGLLYLVFEFVDGTTLRDLVRVKGAQPPERVVAILGQVCTALHEAHQSGVLHRDIKPANIMVYDHLEMTDVVKLLDFGIAKPMAGAEDAPDDETITTAGAVLGTPRYMSPEQLAHQELTPASDIYSLGLVAFELLTGERAIDEETVTGIMRAQLSSDGVSFPRDRLIPSGLRHIVEKMTAKTRSQRYQDLGAVLRDLEHWEDADLPSGVVRVAVVGLVLGLALLAAALILADRRPDNDAVPVPRPATTLGRPAWEVSLDTRGLTFEWLGSTTEYRLKGSADPRAIEPLARSVVAVEREGVAVASGFRWVGSLADWSGESLDHRFVVRKVTESDFHAMVQAEMDGIRAGRPFVGRVQDAAVKAAIDAGNTVQTTQVGWNRYLPNSDSDESPDGLPVAQSEDEPPFAFAKAKAMRAEAAKEWQAVIDVCLPYARTRPFCARRVAHAYRLKGNLVEACKWYAHVGEHPTGLACP